MGTPQAPPPSGRPGSALRVLVIDDHRVFAEVLRLGIETQPDLRCVGVAHSGHEGLARATATGFDVAVLDLDLPDADGLAVLGSLRGAHPTGRVVVLTGFARPDLARRALAAGAAGFLGKEIALAAVFRAIRTATEAAPAVQPPLPPAGPPEMGLTPREHDVLRQLGLGHEPRRIAQNLDISLYTTRDHIKAVMRKLDARSQLDAVVTAERLGLLRLGSRY